MSDDGSYTRVRFHVQRGDGPDQRGEVTVEVSRDTEVTGATSVRKIAERELDDACTTLEEELGL